MTPKTARQIHLRSRPEGLPSPDDFELAEVPVPEISDGEFLVRNDWISVDPYMRARMREGASYVAPFGLGEPMEGGCVQIDPDLAPVETFLGVLGMTGLTAYVGLLEIGKPEDGETVFVSAASGAVGSVVCQIAKIKGCTVVGSAGSEKKIRWLQEEAEVDHAFNYHSVGDVSAELSDCLPSGIDVYYDNVGGDHLEGAIDNMNNYGRVVCCGMISGYNDQVPQPGPKNLFKIIGKRIRMQGFIVRDHQDLQQQFQEEMAGWIDAGKVTWETTVTTGLENAPEAFIGLFKGDNLGKSLVKI